MPTEAQIAAKTNQPLRVHLFVMPLICLSAILSAIALATAEASSATADVSL